MRAGGDLTTAGVSGGSLTATSNAGSIAINGVIDSSTGGVELNAARDVNINQPVLNLRTGSSLTAFAGGNINVNAQIDATTGLANGSVDLTATRDLNVNSAITTRDGAIRLSSTTGAATVASSAGLFAGAGAIALDALGNVTTGTLSGGPITVASRAGATVVSGPISGNGGAMAIFAATQVDINNAITNPGIVSPLAIMAGTDINVNAAVGRTAAGTPSSDVTLTAGQNVRLNDSIVSENGAISLTAQTGAITAAAGEGLFAGSGAISVQSGQTLSTGITATTGALTLRSTAGSVDVDSAISGSTGAVTIAAANDVNVNQAIANPRADALLTVTAGNNINVNAAIDGQDDALAGPSGGVTLLAGNAVALNQSIVSVDAPISVTAQAGTVATAAGQGLYAGSGTISVTSGATLDTGLTSTTGALNLHSTNGNVNVNTAVDDGTGAVDIRAGADVNINQPITNLRSGAGLTVSAGHDINVLAQVDGRGFIPGSPITYPSAPGGAVTMTAGNNLAVTRSIATNDGAVALTAVAGAVSVPMGVETGILTPMEWIVSAGNAPISVSSGASFSLDSPMVTTGSLDITSTGGSVNIAAPISDATGAVTITAADAITVRHQVKSDNQPITLNAGAGGITVFPIVDYDQTLTSPVNSGSANLTLNAVGDVSILDGRGISSSATVTIDTRSQIVTGSIGYSVFTSGLRPQSVILNADGGIQSFFTGYVGSVDARSSGGSITMNVTAPDKVRITTGTPGTLDCPTCDIYLTSGAIDTSLGPDVALNAGGSITLPAFKTTGTADLIARSGDLNLDHAFVYDGLVGSAGRDVNLNSLFWTVGGSLSLSAGRDFVTTATSPIHMSNGESLSLAANRNLTLFLIETLGAVSLTATTGNITLNNDIGPHIINNTGQTDFNPDDKGVASLTISAPANTSAITMQGARAEGDVVIATGGTLTAAKQITSVNGTVSIFAGGGANLSSVPIGDQNQILLPGSVSPVVAPGPRANLPTAPGLAGNGPAGAPIFAEIPVAVADQAVGAVISPAAASGAIVLPGSSGGPGAPALAAGSVAAPGPSVGATGTPPGTAAAPGSTPTATGTATRPATAPGSVAAASGSSDPSPLTQRAPCAPPVRPVARRAERATQPVWPPSSPRIRRPLPIRRTRRARRQNPRPSHDGEGKDPCRGNRRLQCAGRDAERGCWPDCRSDPARRDGHAHHPDPSGSGRCRAQSSDHGVGRQDDPRMADARGAPGEGPPCADRQRA